ncbi:MAG: deoxyribodipyrimidine photolyase [Acidobacteriota bacterium]
MSSPIPAVRLRHVNDAPLRTDGEFVLYWMIAHRRTTWNFSLDHAIHLASEVGKPLVVLEALRCGYQWASDRIHRFVLDGMVDNARAFDDSPVHYLPYVETTDGEGSGLLEALGHRACAVVTDEFPSFFLPRMVAAAGRTLDVRLDAVDSNGLYPLRATDRVFKRAVDLRRTLQKELGPHLGDAPAARPLADLDLPRLGRLPSEILDRWPSRFDSFKQGALPDLSRLPIDHAVAPTTARGGTAAAQEVVNRFFDERLPRYADERNAVEARATSELSPYLHFGFVSVHDLFARLTEHEGWTPERLGDTANGARRGWWGLSEPAESFLDELVTWRELGYHTSAKTDDYRSYESLPQWARTTLEEHADDPRPERYTLDEFEAATTADDVWNAAQRELVRDGRIHNYLRMLWGKKILHWSDGPREALDIMIELNNKYALDGRNPNSYSGIFWCLGRYDRAWGPERPIFGKVRYMSTESTRRKLRLADYLQRYGPD